MTEITRRTVLAATAGASAASLVGRAEAAEQEPAALLGSVEDGKVDLPPLQAPSEGGGALPNRRPPDRRLGVAVVGIGHLTLQQIIPAFGSAKNVRLAALVSGRRDVATAVARQTGLPAKAIYDYAGFDRLKEDPDVDIVYVVLPNAMHREFTERAAAAGKHVLCEKPMATSVADAEAMVAACAQAKRKLMIAYRLQYDAAHREMIRLAREKTYGALRLIEAVNGQNDLANGQWRQIKALAGGGSLPDVGIYCFNAFRYITGEEPIEVTGSLTRPEGDPRFREIEDIATFTLRFPSGVMGVGTSGYSFHGDRRIRCSAEDGWFGLDPAFPYANVTMHIGRAAGLAQAEERRTWTPQNQFAVEMDAFAEAIAHDRRPHTPGEEGLQDMRVLEAIYQAAAGGSAVKLPPVPDPTRGPYVAPA